MNLNKKSIAIGIIALFIGLAITPMSSADINEKEEQNIPVEISFIENDGKITTETIKLTKEDIKALENLIQSLQTMKDEKEIIKKINTFFTNNYRYKYGNIFNLDWLENLQGRQIFSYGKGNKYIARYHARLQIKKLFSTWLYPEGFGTTVIWGKGIYSPPTQILLKRQVGFMVGFVGLYIYIPPLMSGMNSRTFFMGSTLFAWGASI